MRALQFLLVAGAAVQVARAFDVCTVALAVDTTTSTVALSGGISSVSGSIQQDTGRVEAVGNVYVALPYGGCPTTADDLAARLTQAAFYSAAPPVTTNPTQIDASVKTLFVTTASLTLTNLAFAVTTNVSEPPQESGTSKWTVAATIVVLQGAFTAKALGFITINSDDFNNQTFLQVNPAQLTTQGTVLELKLPVWTASQDLGGGATATLTGSLVARADVAAVGVTADSSTVPVAFPVLAPPSPPVVTPPLPGSLAPPKPAPEPAPTTACVIPLTLDSATSTLTIDGQVTAPIQATIEPSGQMTLVGDVYLILRAGSCPATAADLAADLPNALLDLPLSYPPVTTTPESVQANIKAFGTNVATLTIRNFSVSVATKTKFTVIDATSVALKATATVVSGIGEAAGNTFDLAGNELTAQQTGVLTTTGTALTLKYDPLSFLYVAAGDGATGSGGLSVRIKGAVFAAGDLANATTLPLTDIPRPLVPPTPPPTPPAPFEPPTYGSPSPPVYG